MDDRPVGVKLLRRVAAVIRKLFDEILIALPKLVLGAVCDGESLGAEMLQQIFQQTVRQTVFIGPGPIPKNPLQFIGIGVFNFSERLHDCHTNIFGHRPNIIPVTAFGNDKCMKLTLIKLSGVFAVFLLRCGGLLIVHITDSLKEQQREYVLLIGSRINICAEEDGGVPQIGL